jgi:hypothetical protein
MKKTTKQSLIFSAVMIAVCALLCLIPNERLNEYSKVPRADVRIDAVDNSALTPIGIVNTGA